MHYVIFIIAIILLLIISVYFLLQQPQFGGSPSGDRQALMRNSPNFKNGQFQNLSPTPPLTEGATYFGVLREFFFGRDKRGVPASLLPTSKTNLYDLNPAEDLLVWFGHSSYFLQLSGKKFLVDPVLSGYASPFPFTTRSFKGSDIYKPDDLPFIDYLFITHDHYDHLDYKTIVQLKNKVGKIITGLGVGAHLERWGVDKSRIIEKDWYEQVTCGDGFTVHTVPARHFSGRKLKRNVTLWSSFVLITPRLRIYIGGDSGYDSHFKMIGDRFGPFDLAILENGQYNKSWKFIHMMPEEVVQAAVDLKAKTFLPVHWSKFSLALHAWDDSIIRVLKEARNRNIPVLHPMIGEALRLDKSATAARWWEQLA